MEKIENKTANAILEKKIDIVVKGKTYKVSPASIATLIQVSSLLSKMPYIDANAENYFHETLRTARDCDVLGDIAATLILGVQREKGWFSKWFLIPSSKLKFKRLCLDLLDLTPKQLKDLISKLLKTLEIIDFFGLTISLSEVNLLKPTKEVVKTQVSGQL